MWFVVGLIQVVQGRSDSIDLVLGGSFCAMVGLGVGCVHCGVFQSAPITKPAVCIIQLYGVD